MNHENDLANSPFKTDPRLTVEALDTLDLGLSKLVLRDEIRWPWIVLIPRRIRAKELFDLLPADQVSLMTEITNVSAALKAATSADKINVAQFGNMCQQLHIHIIARTEGDPRWPGGVVGVDERQSYSGHILPPWWQPTINALSR